jgi:hypothetical protein
MLILDRLRSKVRRIHRPQQTLVASVLQSTVPLELLHSQLGYRYLAIVGHKVPDLPDFIFCALLIFFDFLVFGAVFVEGLNESREFHGLRRQLSLILCLEVEFFDIDLFEGGFETHTLVDLLDLHVDLVIEVLAADRWHLFGLPHIYLVGRVAEPQLLLVRQV